MVPLDSVAGNTLIGMFTRLILRKPFQVARAAILLTLRSWLWALGLGPCLVPGPESVLGVRSAVLCARELSVARADTNRHCKDPPARTKDSDRGPKDQERTRGPGPKDYASSRS